MFPPSTDVCAAPSASAPEQAALDGMPPPPPPEAAAPPPEAAAPPPLTHAFSSNFDAFGGAAEETFGSSAFGSSAGGSAFDSDAFDSSVGEGGGEAVGGSAFSAAATTFFDEGFDSSPEISQRNSFADPSPRNSLTGGFSDAFNPEAGDAFGSGTFGAMRRVVRVDVQSSPSAFPQTYLRSRWPHSTGER